MKRLFCRVRVSLVVLCLLFSACDPEGQKVSMNVDRLLGGLGVGANIFGTEAETQLGTIIFYRSPRLIEKILNDDAMRALEYRGESRTIIQVQGRLAQNILDNIVYFRKGTILANDSGVVFLVGDLAEEIFDEIRKAFTIDDVFYFEGKEIIVFGGTEALSMLQSMKEALFHYYRHDPAKLGRVMVASYEDVSRLMKDFIYTFYDDLKMVFTTNPLVTAPLTTLENVVKVPSDLVDFPLEGIEQVMMLKGHLLVFSFDSVSKFLAYMTGAENIPESVVLRKSVKMAGEVVYMTSYTVADIFRGAAGTDPEGKTDYQKLRGLLVHPWVVLDIVSETINHSKNILDLIFETTEEILVGYISGNIEALGGLLNLIHQNLLGEFFIFISETAGASISMPVVLLKTVVHFTWNGLSAVVGTLSLTTPLDIKLHHYKVVWTELKGDGLDLWHKFLRLIGFR